NSQWPRRTQANLPPANSERFSAYDRTRLLDACAYRDFVMEIVRRCDHEPGFKVLPRRWVVERTFGWMTRWRRLVRDYEQRLDVSEAMIHLARASLLTRVRGAGVTMPIRRKSAPTIEAVKRSQRLAGWKPSAFNVSAISRA